MKNSPLKSIFIHFITLFILTLGYTSYAQIRTASTSNINQIIDWAKDGVTEKIIFPAGTYNFPRSMIIMNNNLTLEGSGVDGTNASIIRLNANKGVLVDAIGNNAILTNLVLDGNDQQTNFGQTIFRFNKSKGHKFINVHFRNSIWNAINGSNAYATDGLHVKDCVFENIDFFPIKILNRNTNKRNGVVVTSVEQIIIEGTIFKTGYETAISSDNGNDRENLNDTGIGRRYTESTSLSGTIIQNCTFEVNKQFHIAMVQTADVIIRNNTFNGMSDDAKGGAQPLHFEQFSHNIEIYDNTFFMSNTAPKAYPYIHFQGTEGHKRVSQQQPSSSYPDWTYNVFGSNERRADTSCAKTGNIDKDCKRDVHAYGARNIYIAGNIFNASTKVSKYVTVNEGENIQIGTKKDGTVSLNNFIGGDGTKKISFGGNDEGTCDVKILAGQNIDKSNVDLKGVSFDLPECKLSKPIIIEETSVIDDPIVDEPVIVVDDPVSEGPTVDNPVSEDSTPKDPSEIKTFLFYPNPAEDTIKINTDAELYTITISDLSGKRISTIHKNDITNESINISHLSPGIYLFSLKDKDGTIEKEKIVIQ